MFSSKTILHVYLFSKNITSLLNTILSIIFFKAGKIHGSIIIENFIVSRFKNWDYFATFKTTNEWNKLIIYRLYNCWQ